MTFYEFQQLNERRENEANKYEKCRSWGLNNFVLALVGEAGELANLVKKIERGDFTLDEVRGEVSKELADIITYADLIYTKLGLNTGIELMRKFQEINERIGWKP
jgi:NTP pyrophosphatase (non-canonical NTP hydrolase)